MKVEYKLNVLLSRRSKLQEDLESVVKESEQNDAAINDAYKKSNDLFNLYTASYQQYKAQKEGDRDQEPLVKLARELATVQKDHFEKTKARLAAYNDEYDQISGMEIAKVKLDHEIAKLEEEVARLKPEREQ